MFFNHGKDFGTSTETQVRKLDSAECEDNADRDTTVWPVRADRPERPDSFDLAVTFDLVRRRMGPSRTIVTVSTSFISRGGAGLDGLLKVVRTGEWIDSLSSSGETERGNSTRPEIVGRLSEVGKVDVCLYLDA